MSKVKILLLDDHRLFADGLKSLLTGLKEEITVDLETDAQSLLTNLQALLLYDLVLTDIQVPSMNGLIFLKARQAQKIPLRVAVVSDSQSETDVESAIALGACGYVSKDSSSEQMLEAVTKLLNGDQYLPDEMFAFTDWVTARSSNPTLSERQKEVISLIRDGMSNPGIAEVLGLSLSAVKQHVEKSI